MDDLLVHVEKLRNDAAEYIVLSNNAADPAKRDLFNKMAQHLTVLANEVQREIDRKAAKDGG